MTLLKIDAVEAKTGLNRITIWRLERSGRFPSRRVEGSRSVRWIDSEVDRWIGELPRGAAM